MSVESKYPPVGVPRLTAATKAVFGDASFQPNEQGYQAFLTAITALDDLSEKDLLNPSKIELARKVYQELKKRVETLDTPKLKTALEGFNAHFAKELNLIGSNSSSSLRQGRRPFRS